MLTWLFETGPVVLSSRLLVQPLETASIVTETKPHALLYAFSCEGAYIACSLHAYSHPKTASQAQ
jgi:hypothetical protein